MNDNQFNSFMDWIYLDYSWFKNTIEFELMLWDLENTIDKINKETIILKIKEKELRFKKYLKNYLKISRISIFEIFFCSFSKMVKIFSN